MSAVLLFGGVAARVSGQTSQRSPIGLGNIVQTEGGKVAGSGLTMHIFKGIPFAAPPVADLRWRPPQPAPAWTGVRDATSFGPDCMQRPDPRLRSKKMGEDCLYLNVWTPAKRADEKLPVMVFIYGGAFDHGSGSRIDFDGERLASKGVVFVNFNYRMGIFGFLSHPLLTAESKNKCSGDYGLLDQIAALRWVHQNIASFGGDPDRVMIFGQSAGASSVDLMLLTPLAKGLFQTAASESPGEMRALAPLHVAEKYGLVLGDDLRAMRAIPAAQLLEDHDEFIHMRPPQATGARPLWPVIDGRVLPMPERTAYATGHVNVVPLIIGNNAAESGEGSSPSPSKTVEAFDAHVTAEYGDSAPEILRLYPVKNDAEVPAMMARLSADNEFGFGVRAVATDMSKINPSVYRYYFARHIGDRPALPRHADELAYVFGDLDSAPRSGPPAYNAEDRKLSDEMMAYWIHFAATGSPNQNGLPFWPKFLPTTDQYLVLDKSIHVTQDARKLQLEGLRHAYEKNLAAQYGKAAVAP